MATLLDLIRSLDQLPADGTLYAARPWTAGSLAVLVPDEHAEAIDEGDREPPPGLAYFLEVDLAREAVQVWSAWRDNAEPTDLEKLAAITHYAENDAWLPV